MRHKVVDGVTYFEGDWSKAARREKNLTRALIALGVVVLVGLIIYASLTGTTLS